MRIFCRRYFASIAPKEAEDHFVALKTNILSTELKFDLETKIPEAPAAGEAEQIEIPAGTNKENKSPDLGGISKDGKITLQDVKRAIDKASCDEFSGLIPMRVHKYYVKLYLSQWGRVSDECFQGTRKGF